MRSSKRIQGACSSRLAVARPAALLVLAVGAFALLSGCAQKLPARTTVDLMESPAVLEAVVDRCTRLGDAAQRDEECRHAREAVERLAQEQSTVEAPADHSSYERARELRRQRDERERMQREQQEKVDPYTMPLVSDPESSAQSPAPGDPPTTAS